MGCLVGLWMDNFPVLATWTPVPAQADGQGQAGEGAIPLLAVEVIYDK